MAIALIFPGCIPELRQGLATCSFIISMQCLTFSACNPTSPRQSGPSAAELTVEDGVVSVVIVNFKGKVCDSIRFARSLEGLNGHINLNHYTSQLCCGWVCRLNLLLDIL
ncbi:MAG: hypothetical protein K8R17_05685 [Methanosarcinales archaeon]|nr:hypothetical protein [Methanosarcinales archaeon]